MSFLALSLAARGSAEPEGKQWIVLVGVGRHKDDKIPNLQHTKDDVQALRNILVKHTSVPSDNILELSDNADRKPPTLENMRRELPRLLGKAGTDDRVLIYFSCHGYLDSGSTYVIPSDARVDSLKESGLATADLRQWLNDCQAGSKFLILDCCHAGGAKGLFKNEESVERLARAIAGEDGKQTPGTIILGACKKDEVSWEWDDRQRGIFTYWLCRGLEGAADANGDGKIDVGEIYDFLSAHVQRTAKQVTGKTQTPVYIRGADVEGSPVLLDLLPEPPEAVCRHIADDLDLEIREKKLEKVGIVEFVVPQGRTESLASANLPAYCAAQVQSALKKLAGDAYSVLSVDDVKAASRRIFVEPGDLGDPKKMKRWGQNTGMDAVISGSLKRRKQNLHLQCELMSMEGDSLAHPGGLFPLSEELLGDQGGSFRTDKRPPGSPYAPDVVGHAEDQTLEGHPLLDPAFPFKVEVWSLPKGGQAKKKEFVLLPKTIPTENGDRELKELVIPAKDGEVFEIRISNDSKDPVAMALLVDGINTLGQKRERLGEARTWVLKQGKSYRVDGWYVPKEDDYISKKDNATPENQRAFTKREFVFTDLANSVAARKGFGDSIGLITAAFYAEYGRGLGVGAGEAEERKLNTVDFKVGRLLAVVQIRYVDEEELKKLLK
jgi:hypothetical protein